MSRKWSQDYFHGPTETASVQKKLLWEDRPQCPCYHFLFLAHQQQILFKMCVISSLHVISRNAANMKESEGDVCFSSHFKARGNHNGHFGRQWGGQGDARCSANCKGFFVWKRKNFYCIVSEVQSLVSRGHNSLERMGTHFWALSITFYISTRPCMTFMLCGSHNNWSHFHCTFPGKHNISWNSFIPIQGSCSMCGSRCITFCDTLRIWYNSYISFRGRYGICWGFYVTFCSRCSSGQKKMCYSVNRWHFCIDFGSNVY